jgi:N-acylneuraminate cytidylyltransferase
MIGDRSVLGLIPARGGSKGVPRKNLKLAGGKPLIAWTIGESLRSRYLDRVVLSSEDPEIMSVAASLGCEVPFQRPAELSADSTPGIEPVLHALLELPKYDFVVLLQPTSPLRTADDIDACIEHCMHHQANCCVSIVKCSEHPYLMFLREEGTRIRPLIPESSNVSRRQDYPDVFLMNGAVYVASTKWLQQSQTFLTEETIGFEMSRERSLDIDTEADFQELEMVLKNRAEGWALQWQKNK